MRSNNGSYRRRADVPCAIASSKSYFDIAHASMQASHISRAPGRPSDTHGRAGEHRVALEHPRRHTASTAGTSGEGRSFQVALEFAVPGLI